uniref:MATH domain-containing protein n=1 Tax=Globodera pallida TaxID=36090 RepID=A0A183C5U1_GLOPA
MTNFKDFYKQRRGPKTVRSDVEYINGLPWRIKIKDCGDYVGLHLHCYGDETDMAWTCRAAFQCSVISCNNRGECLMKQGELNSFDIYHANSLFWGYDDFVEFEELMDVKNGLYDEKADAVTFKAEVKDFCGENYINNLCESDKLGVNERNELKERHNELFGTE